MKTSIMPMFKSAIRFHIETFGEEVFEVEPPILLEYEEDYGDYTKDRRKIFDEKPFEEIIEEIKERVNIK